MKIKILQFLTFILIMIIAVLAFLYFNLRKQNEVYQNQMEIVSRNIVAHMTYIKEFDAADIYKLTEKVRIKALPLNLIADSNEKLSDSLLYKFENIKIEFLKFTSAENYKRNILLPVEKNRIELTNNFFLEEKKADSIKNLLIQYIDDLKKIDKDFKFNFSTDRWLNKRKLSIYTKTLLNDSANTWEEKTFRNVSPLIAYSVLLTIEYDIYLIKRMLNDGVSRYYFGAKRISEDYMFPLVFSEKTVKLGEDFIADIALGEFNTRFTFSAEVEGKEIPVGGGRARYSVIPKKTGLHEVKGKLKVPVFKDHKVDTINYHFVIDYYVIPK